MIIEISNAAQQDLLDGYHFYEAQTEGLDTYFLDSLTSDIDSLVIYAGIHALHFGNFHRLLAKRFPFAVYYRVEDSIIHIYAVLDCRQNPAWLRNQLVHTDAKIVSRPKVTEEQPKKAYKVGSTRLQHGTTPIASHCAWFAETVWGWDTTENLPESSSSAIPAHSAAIPRPGVPRHRHDARALGRPRCNTSQLRQECSDHIITVTELLTFSKRSCAGG